jgi:hypothetical protein
MSVCDDGAAGYIASFARLLTKVTRLGLLLPTDSRCCREHSDFCENWEQQSCLCIVLVVSYVSLFSFDQWL